jgi:hypothetical protein
MEIERDADLSYAGRHKLVKSAAMTIIQKIEAITGIDIDGDNVVGQEVEWIEEILVFISDTLAMR